MARMSIDDKFLRDPRVKVLSMHFGWTVKFTRGTLLDVYAICYDQVTPLLSPTIIDVAAEQVGFAEAMVTAELAAKTNTPKLLIRGAKGYIEYLNHQKRAGREGGLRSSESRQKHVKGSGKQASSDAGSKPQALGNLSGNPSASVPDAASVPPSASVLPPDAATKNIHTYQPEAAASPLVSVDSKPRKPKGELVPTSAEAASVRAILGKLTEANGVRYTGSDAHTKLIVRQLRAGRSEMDLRKVVAHCRNKWDGNERMQEYLRPETLFGPESIEKYLDPARTEYAAYDAKKISDEHARGAPSSFVLQLNAFAERTEDA